LPDEANQLTHFMRRLAAFELEGSVAETSFPLADRADAVRAKADAG